MRHQRDRWPPDMGQSRSLMAPLAVSSALLGAVVVAASGANLFVQRVLSMFASLIATGGDEQNPTPSPNSGGESTSHHPQFVHGPMDGMWPTIILPPKSDSERTWTTTEAISNRINKQGVTSTLFHCDEMLVKSCFEQMFKYSGGGRFRRSTPPHPPVLTKQVLPAHSQTVHNISQSHAAARREPRGAAPRKENSLPYKPGVGGTGSGTAGDHGPVLQNDRPNGRGSHPCPVQPQLKCRDYRFVEQCARAEIAGRTCSDGRIGHLAQEAFKAAEHDQPRWCLRSTVRQMPPEAFTATIGYLRHRCVGTQCDPEIVEQCEQDIRLRSSTIPSDFDRHQLLRVRLATSVSMLEHGSKQAVDRHTECALIDQTLRALDAIHYRYCFHAHITKCICLHNRLDYHCAQPCEKLIQLSASQRPVISQIFFILSMIFLLLRLR